MKAEEEVAEKDPILRFREYLKGKGLWDETWQAQTTRNDAEIRRAVEAAEADRDFDPADMFDYVFATIPSPAGPAGGAEPSCRARRCRMPKLTMVQRSILPCDRMASDPDVVLGEDVEPMAGCFG
jgi:hypothetical protein